MCTTEADACCSRQTPTLPQLLRARTARKSLNVFQLAVKSLQCDRRVTEYGPYSGCKAVGM